MPRQDNYLLPDPMFSEPVFNEQGMPTPDPSSFSTPHPSDSALYKQIENLLTKDVVSFDPMRGQPSDLYPLSAALGSRGPQAVQAIQAQNQIMFHVAADTGASNARDYPDEIQVADAVTADIQSATSAVRPSFLFHVGDVVYDFGESQYYYDQFYEPYRNYPAPIFAVPGNHDSFIVPNTPPDQTPLSIFTSNFCAAQSVVTQEAGSLHRTAMTQPGVYFALDAPFVRIIGLFSNALEDPGVVSSQGGMWPVPDVQLAFLTAQLQRVKTENYTGAVLLAVHHPPFVYSPADPSGKAGSQHGGSPAMLLDIDTVCASVGVYPHAFLSGHAHNHQRFTRKLAFGGAQISVPFIVVGNGGHHVNRLVTSKRGTPSQEPSFGVDVSYLDQSTAVQTTGLVLDEYDDTHFGYLIATANATQITFAYNQVNGDGSGPAFTPMTIDLASHAIV